MPRKVKSLFGPSPVLEEALEFRSCIGDQEKRATGDSSHLALPKKNFFATKFMRGRFRWIKPALRVEFWRRGEIQHILKLRHMAYVNSINNREPLFHGMNRVTIEISGTKLELRKILHRAQAALGPVDLLIEHPTQAYRIQSETPFLRPDIRA